MALFETIIIFLAVAFIFTKALGILPQRFVKNYGRIVANAREAKGLSGKQLAALLKTTEENISLIESGKKHPSNDIAREIEKHLGIVILRFNTFFVFTLVKTTSVSFFDRFKKHTRFLNFLSDSGLFFGFGTMAFDYLFARKRKPAGRILLLSLSFLLLFVFFNTVLLAFLENPFIAEYNTALSAGFALAGFAGFVVLSLFAYGAFILINVLAGQQVCPGVAPLIPGVELPNVPVVLPLHAWLSFVIILLVHEGMHGIVARKNNYRVKSAGLLLFGFLPVGAFVEPDDEQIKKGDEKEAVRIFSAGASANLFTTAFLIAVIVVFLSVFFIPFIAPWQNGILKEGIEYFVVSGIQERLELCGRVYPGSAFGVLQEKSRVLLVNGEPIAVGKPLNIKPREPLELTVIENGTEVKKTLTPTEFGGFGFSFSPKLREGFVFPQAFNHYLAARDFLASFFFWLIVLNFLVAIVNFLPIEPFDGGKISKILLYPYFGFLKMNREETQKFIGRVLLWAIAIVLLINAVPLFL